MKIKKPIFIIGVGRSGSTIFHEILSGHPNVSWFSGLLDRFPDKSLNRFLMKLIDYPILGHLLKKRLYPSECYDFWEYHCKGFSMPCRDLLAEDVTNKIKEKIPNILSKNLTNKRNRLLVKITGWPRIGFLHEIFNDAKFIHILRDGRAVVNSMVNVNWWHGWGGPQKWRWGELTEHQRQEWEKYNKSFIALAAIEWKILMDALEKAKENINKENFIEVKYEDLCDNLIVELKRVIEFCELEWSQKFERSVKKYHFKNANYKFQKELTKNQKNILDGILTDYLKKYGFK